LDQNSLISVIIPVYKVEQYLPKCLDAVLNQTYRNLEIILVDDGSPDRCGEICDEYAKKDSRIRVIHKENGGLSDARNVGIDAAKGEYLAFADSDDWLEPDAYEQLLSAARRHHASLVCAGRYDEDDRTGECKPGLCPVKEEMVGAAELVRRIFHWDHLDSAAWDKLYARHLFASIRYPVGYIMEDVPTTYRIAFLAGGGVLLPKPLYHYRHRSGSITAAAAVSEKSFHFLQHAEQIYKNIVENYPELERDAKYLLVCALRYTAETLELAGSSSRKAFSAQYRHCRRELLKVVPFAYSCGYFSGMEKLNIGLCASGLLRPALDVHSFVKRFRKNP
jgi:glycosyltransferase involved in cell wall biosynthesis